MENESSTGTHETRHALIDARLIEDTYLLSRRVQQPVRKLEAPLIEPGQAYGSVLRDPETGAWQMYYLHGRFKTNPNEPMDNVGYITRLAESSDGLTWSLPTLGKVELDGNCDNNIVMARFYEDPNGRDLTGGTGPEGFCILDSRAQPLPHVRGRYTALFLASPSKSYGGLGLAHSDDGITWTGYPENPLIPGWHDTSATFFYDPRIERYVIYTRPPIVAGHHGTNRKIARIESADLVNWSLPRMVIDTDEGDHPDPKLAQEKERVRSRDFQWYGLTAFPWQELTVGLCWLYNEVNGHMYTELLHSYDGIDWRREPVREAWLGDGSAAGLHCNMYFTMSTPPIEVGEEMWIYASGANRDHHTQRGSDGKQSQIYLLTLPRDRWVSYDTLPGRAGSLLTRPFSSKGGKLFLNALIEEGGGIQVSFCDDHGHTLTHWDLDKIDLIRGAIDGVRIPVLHWGDHKKDRYCFPTQGQVRIRFQMEKARLFGWSWEE